MKRWIKYLTAFVLLTPVAVLSMFKICGLYINYTPSLPRGLWRVIEEKPLQDARGEAVMLKKGSVTLKGDEGCGTVLLKRVVGLPGDVITYDKQGKSLAVNGTALKDTEIFLKDSMGEDLPRLTYPVIVPKGYVWLCSEHPKGYDSRYFGPVPVTSIDHYVKFVF